MVKVRGFAWDHINLRKIGDHDLEADDIEALFADGDPWIFTQDPTSGRVIALGFVPDGRFVLVVFEHEAQTRRIRVVTAYEPTNEGWWKRYETRKRRKKSH